MSMQKLILLHPVEQGVGVWGWGSCEVDVNLRSRLAEGKMNNFRKVHFSTSILTN